MRATIQHRAANQRHRRKHQHENQNAESRHKLLRVRVRMLQKRVMVPVVMRESLNTSILSLAGEIRKLVTFHGNQSSPGNNKIAVYPVCITAIHFGIRVRYPKPVYSIIRADVFVRSSDANADL